jgi:uncharacterized membrane protein YhaH (DUF805 family)
MEWMLMPLKRYADFSGRSRRMEYWMWVVFQFLIGIAFWILMMLVVGTSMIGAAAADDPTALVGAGVGAVLVFGLATLVSLGLVIPSLAVAVRRLHDTDRSGWWVLAPLGCEIVAFMAAGMAAASPDGSGVASAIAFLAMIATLITGLAVLVFLFLDGTPGPNRYGADPKGRGGAEATFA